MLRLAKSKRGGKMPTKKSTITQSKIKKFERQLNMPITSEHLDEERGSNKGK